jgi:hypothetical protein
MTPDDGCLVRMTIEFDGLSTPMVGWLVEEGGIRQEFQGMLELISLLEAARRSAQRDAESPRRRADASRSTRLGDAHLSKDGLLGPA